MTPENDAAENKYKEKRKAVEAATVELSRCNHLASSPEWKGSPSKPTPRSETARHRSSVFRGFGNDEVFLRACIVMPFKMTAVTARKALKTQLTMYHDLKFSYSVVVDW